MPVIVSRNNIIIGLLLAVIFTLSQCSQNSGNEQTAAASPTYLNHGDSAYYVGKETCRLCHAEIYNTYVQTGMGKSFGPATREKSAGNFGENSTLYDSILDLHYDISWRNDSLYVHEYQVASANGTRESALPSQITMVSHFREHHIDYIVGSGQHTNSHIFSEGGYLFQAPFTYYTQTGKLDFPPGFEDGNNSRFSRPIGLECMSCHNAMPTAFVPGSENKFDLIPNGIDCERCHGPGSIHVNRISRGIAVDTSKGPDYSIVNPKRLSPQLQFEICQRCHLQGNTVLKPGKSFFDFKPGMYLDSVMEIYLPRYANSNSEFIMASHIDRFTQSDCYLAGQGRFVCTTCHNPHVSVQKTDPQSFNKTCFNCHDDGTARHECTADFSEKEIAELNCVACHMPQSGSIDIPHVSVHDHYIRKPEVAADTMLAEKVFLGLKSINTAKPSVKSRITAYLQQYERFEQNPVFLDSARVLLLKNGTWQHWVHYYYLRNDPAGIVKTIEAEQGITATLATLTHKSWDNQDAWSAYRIAEAFRKFNDLDNARQFAERAVELAPNHPEFRVKLSSIYALQENWQMAENGYRQVVAANGLIAEAWSDLGFVRLAQGDVKQAQSYIQKALDLDPDYLQAKINLASVYLAKERWKDARAVMNDILKTDPHNKRINAALRYLDEQGL